MKKEYKVLLYVFIAEIIFLSVLREYGVKVRSWIGNAVGIFIVFLPLEILLYRIGKDEEISYMKRIFAKVFFYYIITCYILASIATLLFA